jgi:hypothetical protein
MKFPSARKFFYLSILSLVTICLVYLSNKYQTIFYRQASPPTYIMVDQFGYRPQDDKVAVIVDPQKGFNAGDSFVPGEIYQVRDTSSGKVIYSGKIQPWSDGEIHEQSGDRAWWFDFSSVKQPGSYLIFDQQTKKQSFKFDIKEDVYRNPLKAAVRMFFYQRSGFAKKTPYADPKWADDAAFLGLGQDKQARYVNDKNNPATERDVSGGWFDAGDTNKYVTFAMQPVNQLLSAYTENPAIWTDDFNIPESGNGIPDLIDEIKWELDWLKRMQDDDGGVLIKVGTIDYNHAIKPSQDKRPRYYAPKCSSSTIAASSMFAHAALVMGQIPQLKPYADDLLSRAIKAWEWFNNNPKRDDCDTQEIKAGDADRKVDEQIADSVVAAIYLFANTNDQKYNEYIQANFQKTRPFLNHPWPTWSVYEPVQGDALLFYTSLQSAEKVLKQEIIFKFQTLVASNRTAYGFSNSNDPYRAYMPEEQYHWGSNQVKANLGNTNYDAIAYDIDAANAKNYQIRALDNLHYLHGVNPLGIVYLTNMYSYGAKYSANEMYHEWFGNGIYDNALKSPNGPAPGYLTGGPNKNYTGSILLKWQPPMKAYFDGNNSQGIPHHINSWEITEPAIYYQTSYIRLVAKFCCG